MILDLDDIRSRINPAYADQIGTESYERRMMVEEIDRLRAEVEALRSAATDFLREYYSRDACNSGPLAQSVERLKAALSGGEGE